MSEITPIIITSTDLESLLPVLDQTQSRVSEALEAELSRATIVSPADAPAGIVTMNSEVDYEDSATRTLRTVQIVLPKDANAAEGRVSVLAPIGSALLGLRVGQSISWRTPGGVKELRVVAVRARR